MGVPRDRVWKSFLRTRVRPVTLFPLLGLALTFSLSRLDAQPNWTLSTLQQGQYSIFRAVAVDLLRELELERRISLQAFEASLIGFYNLKRQDLLREPELLTVIDYSKPSTHERFFVIDLQNRKVLFSTLVAHGRNSGLNVASSFSNTKESKQSSLGFFLTTRTYHGKHGYSLKLRGLEPEFNGNAEKRAIVIHGADYVSTDFIARHGRLGRSWGCPALPRKISSAVIDRIKEGTCLYIHSNSPEYLSASEQLGLSTALPLILKDFADLGHDREKRLSELSKETD